jgi:hypothetical protein
MALGILSKYCAYISFAKCQITPYCQQLPYIRLSCVSLVVKMWEYMGVHPAPKTSLQVGFVTNLISDIMPISAPEPVVSVRYDQFGPIWGLIKELILCCLSREGSDSSPRPKGEERESCHLANLILNLKVWVSCSNPTQTRQHSINFYYNQNNTLFL